jgi:hypothetical protein
LACLASAVAFIFLQPHMLWAVLVVQGVASAALVLVITYREPVFLNTVAAQQRAELLSLVNLLSMLLSIPTGWLAGWLSSVQILSPFWTLAGLFVVGTVLAVSLIGQHKKAAALPH